MALDHTYWHDPRDSSLTVISWSRYYAIFNIPNVLLNYIDYRPM